MGKGISRQTKHSFCVEKDFDQTDAFVLCTARLIFHDVNPQCKKAWMIEWLLLKMLNITLSLSVPIHHQISEVLGRGWI